MNKLIAHKPLIIIGGGGHASVLVDILCQQDREILAVVSPSDIKNRAVFNDIVHLNDDELVCQFDPKLVLLVNGVGPNPKGNQRQVLTEKFLKLGYQFESVISSEAIVSPYAKMESGVQILNNVVIQAGAFIAEHTIINTSAIIEHDCYIGAFSHLAPRSLVCGQVTTASNVYIGAGAVVIQNIYIGENCIIGAGSIITENLPADSITYPSRSLIK